MTKKEVIEFVTKNPMFSLATTEGKQPHVRLMMLYRADENGLIFFTGKQKALYKQLQANPALEMCFYNAEENRQVRIEGAAEILDDLELKKQIVEDFSFLKPWVESNGYEIMVCFCVKKAKAVAWTMETNFAPKQYIQL